MEKEQILYYCCSKLLFLLYFCRGKEQGGEEKKNVVFSFQVFLEISPFGQGENTVSNFFSSRQDTLLK